MKILQIFLFLLMLSASSAYSMQVDTAIVNVWHGKEHDYSAFKYKVREHKNAEASGDFKSMNIASRAGELATLLGDDIYNVDSLVVTGEIDDTDIHTLWDASFNGKLSVINMENATVKSGIIPENAFWNIGEQIDPSFEHLYIISLRRIILPNEIKRIERSAFAYAIHLEEVNIPSALQYLGVDAFYECENLKTDPLVFPEGFERIDRRAVINCWNLRNVILPSTIKEIGDDAFWQAKISSVSLPEGLERIGDGAFLGCRLKEVVIPNSCQYVGTFLFQINYDLEKVRLPEGIERIPDEFADGCIHLRQVNIPSSVKSIGKEAFEDCWQLSGVELPDGLETIEKDAFQNCEAFEQLCFPATLKCLGEECCTCLYSLKRIYCLASEPPVCEKSNLNVGYTPFGGYDSGGTPRDIPVYVPVGSAEKYRNAWGWDYFTNFVETDDFPTAINSISISQSRQNAVYDLSGRKVASPQSGHIYIINGKKRIFAN